MSDRTDIQTGLNADIPDNHAGLNTPAVVRNSLFNRIVQRFCNLIDDKPFLGNVSNAYNFITTGYATITGLITGGSLVIGGGQTVTKIISNTASLSFPLVAAGATSDLTMALTGAVVGDSVIPGIANASMTTNGHFIMWVSAANQITVRFINNDTSPQTPSTGTFRASIVKF